MASRGNLGGLAETASGVVDVMDGGVKLRDPIVGQDDGNSIRCFQLCVADQPDGGILWHRMGVFSSCWTKCGKYCE